MVVDRINETSFSSIKPMLVNIIAGIINTSASIVDLKIGYWIGNWEFPLPANMCRNCIFCTAVVKPTDKTHEKHVLCKMKSIKSLVRDINSGIQRQTTGNNISVSDIGREPGRAAGHQICVKVF